MRKFLLSFPVTYCIIKRCVVLFNISFYTLRSVPRKGIVSPAYTVMEFKNKEFHYDYFWKYIFTSKEFIKRLELITYGIRDGRTISFDEFKEMDFFIPSKLEQQKIASYFCNLDKQISLQTQRLEKLKQIKAACLDKMFV